MYMASIERVCRGKKDGGLGIIDMDIWNKGAYCGFIYKLLSGQDTMWIRWIKAYCLRNKSL